LHRATHRLCALLFVLLAGGWVGGLTHAATATIHVVDRGGTGIPEVRVGLQHTSGYPRHYFAESDANGVAVFQTLVPGSYRVTARIHAASDLVDPSNNPLVEAPSITILEEADSVEATLELWRGSRVVLELKKNRGDLKYFKVLLTHLETGKVYRVALDEGGFKETALVPGRWSIKIEQPPAGFLLVDIEIDGRSVPGGAAEILLESHSPTRFVTWHFMAVARIEGAVDVVRGDGLPTVVAELLEPGPWLLASEDRGGSDVRRVRARYNRDGRTFNIDIPDGRWEVSVFSPNLIQAEPESVVLTLQSGDVGEAHFTVEMEDRKGQSPLVISAQAQHPTRRFERLTQLWIEVWRADESGNPVERVGRLEQKYHSVSFYGLPAGNYLAVALHRDFLESHVLVAGYDPEGEDEDNRHSINLEPGGTVEALSVDGDGQPIAGTRILVERLDDGPRFITDDPDFVASKRTPRAETDASGFLRMRGLYPGHYRATAKLRGEMAVTHFVEIIGIDEQLLSGRDAPNNGELYQTIADPTDELEFELKQSIALDLKVLPAATLRIALNCLDRGPVTDSTAVRIFPVGEPHRPRDVDPDLLDGAWLKLERVTLGGELQDQLLVGPLESDSVQLAVRPTGFGLWTWAYGSERRDDAANFNTNVGRIDDVGRIDIDCSPAIELIAETGDRGSLPDLALTEFGGEARPLHANGEPDGTPYRPRLQAETTQILLREFEEGRLRLAGSFHHPHWLPMSTIDIDFEAELERGQLVPAPLWIPAVGGAIRVFGAFHGARIVDPDAEEVVPGPVVPREDGMLVIESVPVGRYRVEACADDECEEPIAVWQDVEVARGVTTKVRPDE